jgi:hypothetical protein
VGIGLCIETAPPAYFELLEELAGPALEATEPSVCGLIFQYAVEQLRVLSDEGWVCEKELGRVFEPRDYAQLYGEISPDHWYPVVSLGRFLDVLQARICGGDPSALAQHSQEMAKDVLDSAKGELFVAEARMRGADAGQMVLACAQGEALNFSRWHFEGKSVSDFRLLVSEAGAIGEAVRFAVQGVLQLVFSRIAGIPIRVLSERVSGDSILYRGAITQ